jgi:preprotein translocase subunit SecE
MARNRQRAKDRKQRQPTDGPVDDGSEELVDASIAGGAPPDDLGTAAPHVDFEDDDDSEESVDGEPVDDEPVREQVGRGAGDVAAPPVKKGSLVFQTAAFLRACWAELQRVQWPDRRQVGQATAVVLGFVIVAGAFLGAADVVAQKIVDLIL